MTLKICKLLCLILAFSLTPAQAAKTGQKFAKKRADKLFQENVIAIDNLGGHLWVEAMGDAGSVVRLHIEYKGFYVRSIPTLSQAKRGLMKKRLSMTDKFEIVPKAFTVNMTVKTKKHCVGEYGQTISTMSAKLNKTFYMPEPPGEDAYQFATVDWMYKKCWTWLEDQARHEIVVESRQADGGEAYCTLFADVKVDGEYSKTSKSNRKIDPATIAAAKAAGYDVGPANQESSHTQKGRVAFSTGNKQSREQAKVKLGGLSWSLGGTWPINKPFSLEDMSLSYSGSTTVAARKCPVGDQTLSDTSFTLRYQFVMAPMVGINAELEPVDANEKDWMPTPGETREYRLKLIDPGPDQVQGVKFLLSETSEHKGIVTNGGNHVRGEQCPDCTVGVKEMPWPWETFHEGYDEKILTYMRHYTHYNDCPIDSLPDIFFTDADNPDYDLGDNAVSENLKYTVSQVIESDKVSGDTYTVKLRVMDGAACSKLSAYVNVGGYWHQAQAKGDTASKDKTYLMLPRDENQNGLQDTWEDDNGVGGPDEDKDALEGNPNLGDGLSAFEEYRGIYENGSYRRLFVDYLDVFVFDYASRFRKGLLEVGGRYFRQGINLHVLAENEFKYDIINYVDTDHKNGDQYIMVIMSLDQCCNLVENAERAGRGFLGLAFIGPPDREYNTIVMNKRDIISLEDESKSAAGTLGHEIGHGMGLYHHGDTEGHAKIKGHRYWVACLGGQHSGDNDCWMRYNIADKFVNRTGPIVNKLGYLINPFGVLDYIKDYGDYSHFCTTKYGLGQCGDATNGCCLQNIKVKSY